MRRAIASGFLRGATAGAAIVAADALLLAALPVEWAPALWDAIVRAIPGPLFSQALDLLKYAAKPLFLAGLIAVLLAVCGVLSVVYGSAVERRDRESVSRWQAQLLQGAVFGALLSAIAAGASLLVHAAQPALVPLVFSSFAFGILQAALMVDGQTTVANEAGGTVDRARRGLILKVIVGLVVVSGGGLVAKALLTATRGSVERAQRLSAKARTYITPNEDFYQVSKNFEDPLVSGASWELQIRGLVSNPMVLSLDNLKKLDAMTQMTTLECISNEVGGNLIGNASWKGVRLRDLLSMAGIRPEAVDVALFAADGYSDSIPVAKAMEAGTVLAYEMNDESLPTQHGFPVRLLVPGIYGMKNVKWLTRIEPVNRDYKGFWQEQGWSDAAIVRTTSIIDSPEAGDVVGEEVTIAGVAFAGDRGIASVEVSLDAGRTWQKAALSGTEGYGWTLWSLQTHLAAAARQEITVRTTDGRGQAQESFVEAPFPNGASGYHKVTVRR